MRSKPVLAAFIAMVSFICFTWNSDAIADEKDTGKASADPIDEINKESLSKYGKAFTGYGEPLTIEMAVLKEANESGLNDVLLKIAGPSAEAENIDGVVIYHRAVYAGTGYDLQYKNAEGEWRNRIGCRHVGGSWESCEVYFGMRSLDIAPDPAASTYVQPLHLLGEFNAASD